MESLTKQDILSFLEELGKQVTSGTSLMLLSGSALSLLGNPRPALDIDYLADDQNKADFQLSIDRLASQLHIKVEGVPFDRYIPFPEGTSQRHIFYRQFGLLEVTILDPYTIALAKIDRGLDKDLGDVIFLIQNGLVELDRLQSVVENALERAAEFDLHPDQARQHLEVIRQKVE
jgi:Nucleotidyltransferase of unknown function (DUF6036)